MLTKSSEAHDQAAHCVDLAKFSLSRQSRPFDWPQ